MIRDIPSHYHSIVKATARYAAYVKAVQDQATEAVNVRKRANETEEHREVHVTGKPKSQKGD